MIHLLHKRFTEEQTMEMLHVRLKTQLHKELKAYCALNGISMTSIIGDIIQKYLLEIKGN